MWWRILLGVGLMVLSVVVLILALVIVLIRNTTGAPQPDGEVVVHPVVDGRVTLAADTGYELGSTPDMDHPDYRGGVTFASPECTVHAPDGSSPELLDVDVDPTLNRFTRYARFHTGPAGEYLVRCADVVPVPAELVVQTDVWATARAEAAERTTHNIITGVIAGLLFVGLNLAAITVVRRGRG